MDLPFKEPERIPGGYAIELFSRPDVLDQLGEVLQKYVRAAMREGHGGMPLTALLFCRNHPVSGVPEEGALYKFQLLGDHNEFNKYFYNEVLRAMSATAKVRAVAIMMEAWFVSTEDGSVPKGNFEHIPGRLETVWLSIETLTAFKAWTALVTRPSPTSHEIGAFKAIDKGTIRFTSVMSPSLDTVAN